MAGVAGENWPNSSISMASSSARGAGCGVIVVVVVCKGAKTRERLFSAAAAFASCSAFSME